MFEKNGWKRSENHSTIKTEVNTPQYVYMWRETDADVYF